VSGYQLSLRAVIDIEEIFQFSVLAFGLSQAEKYHAELENVFATIASDNRIGKTRSELRIGLRSFAYRNHIVFYKILKDGIFISRVLHGSKDLPEQYFGDI
jgi:toxin ParE1/3/4